MQQIEVGDFRIEALTDGLVRLPTPFFPGLDPAEHPEILDPDGTVHVPTGGFLVRGLGRTIVVDTGFGPRETGYPADRVRSARDRLSRGHAPGQGRPDAPDGRRR